jgi:hypothetical protein
VPFGELGWKAITLKGFFQLLPQKLFSEVVPVHLSASKRSRIFDRGSKSVYIDHGLMAVDD